MKKYSLMEDKTKEKGAFVRTPKGATEFIIMV